MPVWVGKILQTISNPGIAVDVTQDARFFYIKSELNKLDNIDVHQVKENCILLLCENVKDLRLFVYLVFACLLENSMDWIDVIKILNRFLSEASVNWFPQKIALRQSCLRWLNQDRVKNVFLTYIQKLEYQDLIDCQCVLRDFNILLLSKTELFGGHLSLDFESWVKDLAERRLVSTIAMSVATESIPIESEVPIKSIENTSVMPLAIQSVQEMESATQLIVGYCEQNGRWIQAAAYRRALRWAALMPRVDSEGVTGLAPFSEKNISLLDKCEQEYRESPKACYVLCEHLLLETGGQLKLDIQYYAIQAARLFNDALSHFLTEALRGFLQQYPGVTEWRYSNKVHCTSASIKKWIVDSILVNHSADQRDTYVTQRHEAVLAERDLRLLKQLCGIM